MSHELYMKRCLELAAKGKQHVAPNPMVGAVLVYEGRIIGEGWHQQYGKAHAEVSCIEDVLPEEKHLIADSTLYVSLEPCAHYGKTPPCADRIVKEGIKKVVVCNVDPFEKVGGRGLQMLRDNSIDVRTGISEAEGLWLNRRFFCFHQQERSYIILKWAQTSNGFFAPSDRSRYQISKIHSKLLVHKWRTEEAAIMVGYTTALQDDPQLTARLWKGKNPLRIVTDRQLQLPPHLHVFNNEAETWILNDSKDETAGNKGYVKTAFEDTQLTMLLKLLHNAGKTSLVVEGGAKLLQSFIEAGLWDEARVLVAENSLKAGIAAPLLKNAVLQSSHSLAGDWLDFYTHADNAYPYCAGIDL